MNNDNADYTQEGAPESSPKSAPEAAVATVKVPTGIKIFSIGIIVLTLCGILVNGRFYSALFAIREAGKALHSKGDAALALAHYERAAKLVPENNDVQTLKKYYQAIDFMHRGDIEQALPLMEEYRLYDSEDGIINFYYFSIMSEKSFDAGDYAAMADYSKKLYEIDSSIPMVQLQYASSLACLYAANNDEAARNKAQEIIASVKSQSAESQEGEADQIRDYIARIEYRIVHKKIISAEEYASLSRQEK